MIKLITSTQNNQVKQWRKLHTKKHRMQSASFLIEGFHLVEEALKSDWEIETIIVQSGVDIPSWMQEKNHTLVDEFVFKEISQTETPQGIAAVIKMKSGMRKLENNVLLIDGIQDPGNLGTIIRTADAAGFTQIILGKGTVDVYNDKVIRASQGSIFHLVITEGDLLTEIPTLQGENYTVFASALEDSVPYNTVNIKGKVALIMGNEGAGISQAVLDLANERIKIPIYGKAESLNVSIAAGILMYHMRK